MIDPDALPNASRGCQMLFELLLIKAPDHGLSEEFNRLVPIPRSRWKS